MGSQTQLPTWGVRMELPRVSKKLCLLAILVFLCLIITCNLLLTVWIITSIRLNFNGLGSLSTVTNGTKIDGTTFVMDNLHAKQISSSPSSAGLELLAEKSVTMTSAGNNATNEAKLIVKDNMEIIAGTFTITDTLGEEILSVDESNVRIGRNKLTSYSAILESALQTRQVSSRAGKSLHIQSPTSFLTLEGNQGVDINATSGDLTVDSLNDVKIQSRKGKIILSTASLFVPDIPIIEVEPDNKPSSRSRGAGYSRHQSQSRPGGFYNTVYQVCVCGNGKLFLAP